MYWSISKRASEGSGIPTQLTGRHIRLFEPFARQRVEGGEHARFFWISFEDSHGSRLRGSHQWQSTDNVRRISRWLRRKARRCIVIFFSFLEKKKHMMSLIWCFRTEGRRCGKRRGNLQIWETLYALSKYGWSCTRRSHMLIENERTVALRKNEKR